MTDGSTIVPDDGRESTVNSDPCIRYLKDGEGVAQKVVTGQHKWIWKDLLVMRQCTTCGVERPFTKLFEGQ